MARDIEASEILAPALDEATRARGRRLAISSHPAGMTFMTVYSEHLPTLLLVYLGASEFQIGLQGAFLPALQLLQLPTLRQIARIRKRTILVLGQVAALIAALPLLFLDPLLSLGEATLRVVALASFALVAVGLNVGNTVWFSLLRSYVEAERIGRFFAVIRSSWHLALIVYFVAVQQWLAHNPGSFTPPFAAAWLLGLLRVGLISRMPERSERTAGRIRVREAFARVREDPKLQRYLAGVSLCAAVRSATVPFAIVMMRREIGFSDSHILLTTIAYFGGGLASLYLWGRVADQIGSAPVFRFTALGMAALLLLLRAVDSNGPADLALLLLFFAGFSALTAGFGLADTRVLFQLAPPEAPARTLMICGVITNGLRALAPVCVGLLLDQLLGHGADRLAVYHGFFTAMAAIQALAFVPLRGFTRTAA